MQQVLLMLCLVGWVHAVAQATEPCPTSTISFTGTRIGSIDPKKIHFNTDPPRTLKAFSFYVNGRVAYPPDLGCDFPFRCTTERSTPDTCLGSEAGFMHGVYIVRDKKSRTWIEQRYVQGYIVEHTEYNGRTGRKRGRFEYLDSAWMTTDGVKVIMELFDEKTGEPTSRLRWVLQDGTWRWTR